MLGFGVCLYFHYCFVLFGLFFNLLVFGFNFGCEGTGICSRVFLVFAYLFLIEAVAFEIETSLNECLLLCFAPVRY